MLEEFAPYRTLFIVGFVLIIAWNLFHVLRAVLAWHAKNVLSIALYSYLAVGFLWPTSLIAKILVIGPDFLRWYVGDIGFVLMLPAYTKLMMSVPPHKKTADELASQVYRRTVDNLCITRNIVIIMTGVVTGYEVLTGILYKMNPDVEPVGVGSFDPVDVVMYVLGAFVGVKLLNVMAGEFRKLAKASEAHEALVAAELRAQQRQNRKRPRKSRKHINPSRK